MNQHIQKQIIEIESKVGKLSRDVGVIDMKPFRIILKTSLESIWEEAEKDTLRRINEAVERKMKEVK